MLVLLVAASVQALENPPGLQNPQSIDGFEGTIRGTVGWVHDSTWWLMLDATEVTPVGPAAERADPYRRVMQNRRLRLAVRWSGPQQPHADDQAWVRSLPAGDTVTVRARAQGRHLQLTDTPAAPEAAAAAGDVAGGAGPVEVELATGADIDESAVSVTLHVRSTAPAGGDGTRAAPFGALAAGLAAAVQHLEAGEATLVLVHPGAYREGPIHLDFSAGQARDTLLVIEGADDNAGGFQPVFSGSDVYPADRWEDHGDGLISTAWDHDWGHFTYNWGPPRTLGHRREMVFVDGSMLRQVEIERYSYERNPDLFQNNQDQPHLYEGFDDPTADPAVLPPGSFGVAERDENGNRLFVRVPEGVSLDHITIEVAERRQQLIFGEKRNLVVRGMTFQHFANDYREVADLNAITWASPPQNVLLEDLTFRWNNFVGLSLAAPGNVGGRDMTVRRCVANYNGWGGFTDGGPNVLVEDCTTNWNNWRGHWGNQRGWNMGGYKFGGAGTGPVTVRGHTAVGNLTHGIWSDIHPRHVAVIDSVAAMNARSGLDFELSNGPHLSDGNLLVLNREAQAIIQVVGDTAIRRTVAYGNTRAPGQRNREGRHAVIDAQYYLRGDAHGRQDPVMPNRLDIYDSVIVGGPDQQTLIAFLDNVRRDHPTYGRWTLWGDGNVLHAQVDRPFQFRGADWSWQRLTLGAFAERTSLSPGNRMADPGFRDPDRLDFRVNDNSPLADRDDLPLRRLPAGWVQQTREFFEWAGADTDYLPAGTD